MNVYQDGSRSLGQRSLGCWDSGQLLASGAAGAPAPQDTRSRQRPSSGGTSAVTDGLLSWAMRRRSDAATPEPNPDAARDGDHPDAAQLKARSVKSLTSYRELPVHTGRCPLRGCLHRMSYLCLQHG